MMFGYPFTTMRLRVNLSRRPFVNHRLLWTGVIAVAIVCLVGVLWIGSEKARVRADAERIRQTIRQQEQAVEEERLEQERLKQEQKQTPLTEQQTVELEAAHQLIARKAFYWNKLIGDIEGYVPNDVRIQSIKMDAMVDEATGAMALVEVKALGRAAAQVTEMMGRLDESKGMFIVDQATQDPTADSGEIPFTLKMKYWPSREAAR
jgi:Tfp pilus assembly protein PilN